ncbi:MAG: anhydro-N-acetylmuramic acid kinase [Niabella sp.]
MIYRAIGLMSGSSLDGLDIVFAELTETRSAWSYEIIKAACIPYTDDWVEKLKRATELNARDYQLLHTAYGRYIGQQVNAFIEAHGLQYQVGLVVSHGHTTFHLPGQGMTAQLGDGAAIAAMTKLPVVSDLRAMDVANGGQGAPIVPIGEKLLFGDYGFYLNIGGIANISINGEKYQAYDVCAANRVLNMLANDAGQPYDKGGALAAGGQIIAPLLHELNNLEYYKQPSPKSLANSFGTDIIYPLVKKYEASVADQLCTYAEHIAIQVSDAVFAYSRAGQEAQLLATGGGALNTFLIARLQDHLSMAGVKVVVPDENLVNYKEALIMALIGVLRWREENNVLSSVTGAARDSVGGAMWMGQEA